MFQAGLAPAAMAANRSRGTVVSNPLQQEGVDDDFMQVAPLGTARDLS